MLRAGHQPRLQGVLLLLLGREHRRVGPPQPDTGQVWSQLVQRSHLNLSRPWTKLRWPVGGGARGGHILSDAQLS